MCRPVQHLPLLPRSPHAGAVCLRPRQNFAEGREAGRTHSNFETSPPAGWRRPCTRGTFHSV
eukprot:4450628-Pleurochrysis_carterae.AAC.4